LSLSPVKKIGKKRHQHAGARPTRSVSASEHNGFQAKTNFFRSGNGNARSKTPLTTLKIAVRRPRFPSASVSTTITLTSDSSQLPETRR